MMWRASRMCARSLGGGIAAVFLVMGVPHVLAGPLAYISNLDEASVTVLDTASLTETATIPLPGTPSAIVAGASGTHDGITFAPIASIPADFDLQIIALSRGLTIGAANSGIGITIFDTSTNTSIGEVPPT